MTTIAKNPYIDQYNNDVRTAITLNDVEKLIGEILECQDGSGRIAVSDVLRIYAELKEKMNVQNT